jgi:mannose-6-phosphate isomerase-like protein (cupin superfamily)
MNGYIINIERETRENTDYRRVLYTAHKSQLVVMSLKPGDEIGEETHDLDQFIRIEEGAGEIVLSGIKHDARGGIAVLIPAGVKHNVINTGDTDLKLFSIYSPPEHRDGLVHKTKADETEDHFDGKTTE